MKPLKLLYLSVAIATVCSPAVGQTEWKFDDAMESLKLSDPGFAWYGYHDNIVCADWDGDGDVDILVVTSPSEKSPKGGQARLFVNLLKETGKLAFEDRTDKLLPEGIAKKLVADTAPFFFDVNNDGKLDICSISDEMPPATFINEGDHFRLEKWGFNAQVCELKDVNGDGLIDVIGCDTGRLYINKGEGKFQEEKLVSAEPSGHMPKDKMLPIPEGITVDEEAITASKSPNHVYYFWKKLDLNGDGKDDYYLLLSQPYAFKLSRFYFRTDSGYKDQTSETGLPVKCEMYFADVNGDGLLDAIAMGSKEAGVYFGDGKGHFKAAEASDANKVFADTTGGLLSYPQAIVDFDGDGVLDILTYQARAGSGSVLLGGLGQGKFQKVLATKATSGECLADLDNDGKLDVISSGPVKSQGLHIYLNRSVSKNHWLKVNVTGPANNRFAIGAVVEAYKAGQMGKPQAMLGRGIAGRDGLPIHLGLADNQTVDLRVTSPFSPAKEFKAVPADQAVKYALEQTASAPAK